MIQNFLRNTVFAVAILLSGAASAEHVGITRASFEPHYRVQKTINWCWASSAEMVLAYSGVKLEQDAIVARVRGIPLLGSANPMEMIQSTNGVFPDAGRKKSIVVSGQMVAGAPTTAVLYNQLKNNRPVVLTYQNGPWSGHAVVLTAIDAEVQASGVTVSRFYVFDPFPFQQQLTQWGPQLVENPDLRYQQLDVIASPVGLQLVRNGIAIGALSGMILVDASTK